MGRGDFWQRRGVLARIAALVFFLSAAVAEVRADDSCPLLDIHHSRKIRAHSSYQILKPPSLPHDLDKIRADLENIAIAGLVNWRLKGLNGPLVPEYRYIFRDEKWSAESSGFVETIPRSLWPVLLDMDQQAKRAMPAEFPYSVSRISIRWTPENKSGMRQDWHQDGFVYVVVMTLEGPTTLVMDERSKTHFSAALGIPTLLTGATHPHPPEVPTWHKTPEFNGQRRIFIQMGYELLRSSNRQSDFMDLMRKQLGL